MRYLIAALLALAPRLPRGVSEGTPAPCSNSEGGAVPDRGCVADACFLEQRGCDMVMGQIRRLLAFAFVLATVPAPVAAAAGLASAPSVKAVSPLQVPRDGRVAIMGTNLFGARVTFGALSGVHTTVNASGTRIITYVPARTRLGKATVKVTTRSGSATAPAKLLIEPVP
jgi:hypothetical protein